MQEYDENTDTTTAVPDPGDLIAATTPRWSWDTDEGFARSVESSRGRRDRRAEAHSQLARAVVEHDLPWPMLDQYPYDREDSAVLVAYYRVEDLDKFRLLARGIRRAIGGMTAKTNTDGSLTATVDAGLIAWDVRLTPDASPCEQVQVGTEAKVVREEVAPPRYREIEREEPVYEWRCPDSVLDEDTLAEATEAADEPEPEQEEAPEPVRY